MLIHQKIGNLNSFSTNKRIDWLQLEWYEVPKRILHKKTNAGINVSLKFMAENQQLKQGDILWEDAESVIAVDIEPCDAICVEPKDMAEMASVCYEIGNKHLPLFYQDNKLFVPFEQPLFKLLAAGGYQLTVEKQKLFNQLKTTVSPHASAGNNNTLFSKIMQLTSPKE